MTVRQLSDGNDSGTVLGQSTSDKLGFFGTSTPVAQPSITAIATATATTTLLETRISRLETALRNLNLINTAG
jgi:hypothetical protein